MTQPGESDIPLAFADRIASNVSRRVAPAIVTATQVRRVFTHGVDSIGDDDIGNAIEDELCDYGLRGEQ